VPTFWLDKVCIDQSNIADGLRVLPVNVMACNRVMVLCGHTYQHRLWCIWELFTLLAFARLDQAVGRLLLMPLKQSGEENDVAYQLKRFDVKAARCYDPNEEARLRSIIVALGEDQFNQRIQKLGATILQRQSHSGIVRSTSLSKVCGWFRRARQPNQTSSNANATIIGNAQPQHQEVHRAVPSSLEARDGLNEDLVVPDGGTIHITDVPDVVLDMRFIRDGRVVLDMTHI